MLSSSTALSFDVVTCFQFYIPLDGRSIFWDISYLTALERIFCRHQVCQASNVKVKVRRLDAPSNGISAARSTLFSAFYRSTNNYAMQ
jgi:hypothetical protein